MDSSAWASRLRTSTTVTRSPRSSMSLKVLASMLFGCFTIVLPVLALRELRSQQGPGHTQHRARRHHQVDGDLVPLQHHEREDVEAGQGDTSGEQDLRGEVHREVRDDAYHGRRDPDEDGPKAAIVGEELYVRGQEEDEQEAR